MVETPSLYTQSSVCEEFRPESSPFSSLVYGFKEYCPMGHDIQETPRQELVLYIGKYGDCASAHWFHLWGGAKMTNLFYVSAGWKSQQVRNAVPSNNKYHAAISLLEWIISNQCYVSKHIKSNQLHQWLPNQNSSDNGWRVTASYLTVKLCKKQKQLSCRWTFRWESSGGTLCIMVNPRDGLTPRMSSRFGDRKYGLCKHLKQCFSQYQR